MLSAIKASLNPQTDNAAALANEVKNQLMLTTAALMVEVMAADHEKEPAAGDH